MHMHIHRVQDMPRAAAGTPFGQLTPIQKRTHFHDNMQWDLFHNLIVDAGMLVTDGIELDGRRGVRIDIERTAAMLTLTAVRRPRISNHLPAEGLRVPHPRASPRARSRWMLV